MKINLKKTNIFRDNWLIKTIMRTFIFLFCTVAFSLNPNSGFSQNRNIIIDNDKTISIEAIFNLIKNQTDYQFVYDAEMVSTAPLIKLNKGVIKSNTLLIKGLDTIGCTFEFASNTVVVRKKTIADYRNQDEFIITGKVKNKRDEALFGAAIVVSSGGFKETGEINPNFTVRGTQTDFDGSFQIKVAQGQKLSVSYVGYEYYEITISSDQTEYEIILEDEINYLEEVVLTGYTKTEKENSTVASSKISKKDLSRQKAINLVDRLEGLSPGLNITSVTNQGGQRKLELILRGLSTFDNPTDESNGQRDSNNSINRQPLIVLDGFPYEGPFNDIDPQTIETIDILRDAAATTLWGVRASNGVLVITTKRGVKSNSKPTITYTSNTTIGTRQDLSGLQLANSAETIKVLNNTYAIRSDFNTSFNAINNTFRKAFRYAPLNSFETIWADFYNNVITDAERDSRLAALSNNNVLDDFEKYLISPGFIQEHSLSMRGGSEVSSYSFTATHVNEKKSDLGDDFRRLNLSLTTDFKLTEKLSAVADVSVTSSETNDNAIGVAELFSVNPIQIFDRLVDENGRPQAIRSTYGEFQDEFSALGFDDASYNPIADQKLRDNELKSFNLRLAAGLNYKITKSLTADIKYQFNRITDRTNNNKDVNLFEIRTNNNLFVGEEVDANGIATGNPGERLIPYGGVLENQVITRTNTVLRGSLSFNETFNKHNVSALAGMEVTENIFDLTRRQYFGYNDVTGISNVNFDPTLADERLFGGQQLRGFLGVFFPDGLKNSFQPEVVDRSISTFGNINYTYNNKYNLSLSGKIDQKTAFGINERLSKPILWAVGASWNLDKEDFFKVDWVNDLKLRASYGINGNLRPDLTTKVTIEFSNNVDFINGQNSASFDNTGNPNLTFEETTTKNIGLDFGLFSRRIVGALDVYDRQSVNLLVPFAINSTFGQAGTVLRNDGKISNRGIELNLNLDILKNTALKWNANFNISHNKNEVLAYSDNQFTDPSEIIRNVRTGFQEIVGTDISAQYRFKWAGLDIDGNPQVFNENGDIVGYQEATPTQDALVLTKPFIAPTFGGIRNTFEYKNFALSFLASFKFGHVFQESLDQKYGGVGATALHRDVANAWEFPGDEFVTDIPAIPRTQEEAQFGNFREQFFTQSDYNIQDAAFIRLRDITLGYNLDSNAVKKIGLEAVNFSVQARNLGLLWKANDVDLDPESVPFVTDSFNVTDNFNGAFRPGIQQPITFVFGVNLNF